jgi:hypothetical protein
MPPEMRPARPLPRFFAVKALAPLCLALATPAFAGTPSAGQLQSLETALNSPDDGALNSLLQPGPGLDPGQIRARRLTLRQQFPNARWQVLPASPLRDGRPTVTVSVSGTRTAGGATYRLQSEQQLALTSDGQRINGQTVLREQSLLRSGEQSPSVTVQIPDVVLTGQRYDVDVIFDEPLDGALLAGGLAAVSPEQIATQSSPNLELSTLWGGGLFKSVQAPLSPGSQTWAVLLVHPKGVISASKLVRVVSDRRALQP